MITLTRAQLWEIAQGQPYAVEDSDGYVVTVRKTPTAGGRSAGVAITVTQKDIDALVDLGKVMVPDRMDPGSWVGLRLAVESHTFTRDEPPEVGQFVITDGTWLGCVEEARKGSLSALVQYTNGDADAVGFDRLG